MSALPVDSLRADEPPLLRASRELALGALYWLAFLLALEPGNLVRAAAAGLHPGLGAEGLRIALASLLAAPTCPLILALARRRPVAGAGWGRNALIHAAVLGVTAPSLIVIGGLAATWMPPTSIRGGVAEQLAANVALLAAAMAALDIGAHLARARRSGHAAPAPERPARIAVPGRGRTLFLDVGELDWIEAQGNYLGLRAGGAVHLVRDTLTGFHSRLDPESFVRIHRGRIVNIERVREVVALGNGDALVRLQGGAELRASRGFGEDLRSRLRDRERATGNEA
jgi:hypothetical protein